MTTTTTTKSDKALDLFNLLMAARNETLPAIFEAKAKLDTAGSIVDRLMADDLCELGKTLGEAFDKLADERTTAERVLDAAINDLIERNDAMWEAHTEFVRLYEAEQKPAPSPIPAGSGKPRKPSHLASVN